MITQKSGLAPLSLALFLAASLSAQTEPPKLPIPATSPPSTVKQRIGATDFEVTYNRPSVKGRYIFGALVPYGEVWRPIVSYARNTRGSTPR